MSVASWLSYKTKYSTPGNTNIEWAVELQLFLLSIVNKILVYFKKLKIITKVNKIILFENK